jgi:hypothetical protein
MATVQPNRTELQTRVRHPLQTLRKYIRAYVTLEGAAVAVCYLALWFWIGLLLDYGLFWLTGFDWVQEADLGLGQGGAWNFRFVLFLILTLGLIGVVAVKVVLRLFREFRDDALALVLERRYPKELGDRLITAVEMADPKLAEKYGHSQEMVDVTVQEAARRVETLPVKDVFNWGRLYRLWLVALGLTFGVYLLAAIGCAALGQNLYGLHDNAAIWSERAVTLQPKPYWLRQSQLEYVRFQDTAEHPGEMRVARDEQRPDLLVRALQWVVADRNAHDGWRALAWADLPRFLPAADVQRFQIPSDWPSWVIDLDDLDPNVPVGLVPPAWQNQTSGQIRKHLAEAKDASARRKQLAAEGNEVDNDTAKKAEVWEVLERSGALPAVDRLLDWTAWSVDKLYVQHLREDVRRAMKDKHADSDAALETIFAGLADLADAPSMSRTLRRLRVPGVVQATFRGKSSKRSDPIKKEEFNKYTVPLRDLKESARVTVRGEDYYTPYKLITLVPPPGLTELTVDKEEPAYIYWRLIGDQAPLKGQRQKFVGVPVGFTGEYISVPVPAGTSLTLHARVDRPLKPGIRLVAPSNRLFKNSITIPTEVVLGEDRTSFDIAFKDVSRETIEFDVEYADLDNVKGKRRVVIEPIQDQRPDWGETALGVVLRTPKLGKDAGQGPTTVGMLITPKAILPFKAQVRDDYGLTEVNYVHEYSETEFELATQPKEGKDKTPVLVFQGGGKDRWAAPIVSGFVFPPGGGAYDPSAGPYWAWLCKALERDVARVAKRAQAVKGETPVFQFRERLEEKAALEVSPVALPELLKARPPGAKEQGLKPLNREGLTRDFKLTFDESLLDDKFLNHNYFFSMEKLLPQLAPSGPKSSSSSGPQLHYQLKIALLAKDNNVETGPGAAPSKVAFTFLVVSENELLSQIVAEEEELRGNMERAMKKLEDARTALTDGIVRLKAENTRLDEPATRLDQARKGVQETFGSVQEIYNNYNRILKEMKVNRVKADLIARVNDKIVKELREALSPNNGFFMLTEEALTKAWQDVDEAAVAWTAAEKDMNKAQLLAIEQRRSGFRTDAEKAQDYLDRLIAKLRGVLDSMGDEIGMKELIAQLVDIERIQRQSYLQLRDHFAAVEDDTLRGIMGGPPEGKK